MRYSILIYLTILSSSFLSAQDVLDVGLYNQHISLIEQGWDLIKEKKFKESVGLFEKAIAINNGNADAYVGAATASMHLKELSLAQNYVDTALSLAKNQSDIYYLAGNISFNSGNYNKAILCYTVAINNNENSEVQIELAKVLYNRANAHLAIDNYQEAIVDYNNTLDELPDFADAYHNRGIAFQNMGEYQNACRDFHAATHFGSSISEKYLIKNCQEINFNQIDYQNIVSSSALTGKRDNVLPFDYSDTTFTDTLYYGLDWKLTTKELSSYYRIGTLQTKSLKFKGDFTDYFKSGQVLLKGAYDRNGRKTGLFERFYESGKIYSIGNYAANELIGSWKYFHENGNLSEVIEFEKDDYYVLNSWDEIGRPGVKNGSGKWKKTLSEQDGVKYVLIGHFKHKKKVKQWIVRTGEGTILHTEYYKNGEFIRAEKSGGIFGDIPVPQSFSIDRFYPESLSAIENFEVSNHITMADYPYIPGLPQKLSPNDNYQTSNAVLNPNTENRPTYTGGMESFYRFVANHLEYPIEARKKGITGQVIVAFKVEKDGSISNVHCINSIGGGLDEEAVRVVSLSNQWVPAIENDEPVAKSIAIPIIFRLSN